MHWSRGCTLTARTWKPGPVAQARRGAEEEHTHRDRSHYNAPTSRRAYGRFPWKPLCRGGRVPARLEMGRVTGTRSGRALVLAGKRI